MSNSPRSRSRRRLSLSWRLSLLLLGAAVLPLVAAVGITNYLTRNSLVAQGRATLSTYASARVALLDSYLHERVLDGGALASLETAPELLACEQLPLDQLPPTLACDAASVRGYVASVARALVVGTHRDQNYTAWTMYDRGWHLLLSSNPQLIATGGMPVPQEDQTPVDQGKPWISGVYDDPKTTHASIYIYYPIVPDIRLPASATNPVLGALQATLRLDTVWSIVQDSGKLGANHDGSYAFVTDANGVRIADGHANELFTSVAPLAPAAQQLISSEQRYGNASPVPVTSLPQVASQLAASASETAFQSIAVPGSQTLYQYDRIHLQNVPWTYFVLSPLASVTAVADDQLRTSLVIAGVVALLAVLLGLLIGTRTAAPVQRSVADLRGASATLNGLAAKQQNSASEQLWVVDACKTGLESVRYLSDAMHQAAHRVVEAGNWFGEYWDRLNEDQAQRTVQHLRELAQYIEEAARRQWASSERLDKAITVTTQVSDQLANGAAAAATSAGQLEAVVDQLRRVVGGRQARDDQDAQDTRDAREAVLVAGRAAATGGGQRALPAPAGPMQGYPGQGEGADYPGYAGYPGYPGQIAPDAPALYGPPAGPNQGYGLNGAYAGNGRYGGAPPNGNGNGGGWGGANGWGNGQAPAAPPGWGGRATNGPGVQVWEDR
jgi:hypothetical protein